MLVAATSRPWAPTSLPSSHDPVDEAFNLPSDTVSRLSPICMIKVLLSQLLSAAAARASKESSMLPEMALNRGLGRGTEENAFEDVVDSGVGAQAP